MRFLRLSVFLLPLFFSCSEKVEDVSKEDALLFSRAIDSSIRYKKPFYFNSLINEKAFASKIARASGAKLSSAMLDGVKNSLAKSDLGDNIIQAVQQDGFYELVKQYEKGNTQHLIFRLYSSNGLNYHDFELAKRNGKTGIADIFIYSTGEDFSKTLAGLMQSFSEKAPPGEARFRQLESVKKLKDYVFYNQNEKALKFYKELPESLKNVKAIQILYIQICSRLDDETYLNALEEFRSRFPDDPNMYLVAIDGYILHKQYDKAQESIDSIDRMINTDPFLDYMRALIYTMMEQQDKAIRHLEKLHTNMPAFDDGVVELIANYISAGQDGKARELVKEYEKNEKFDQSLLDNYLYTQPQFSRYKTERETQ